MKQDKVNINVVPDLRRQKDQERFPLKLRLTHKGLRKYYGTGYDASTEEWNILNAVNVKGNLRKIKNALIAIENNAHTCCDQIIPFSFQKFETEFFKEKIEGPDLKRMFFKYIEKLKRNEQVTTAISYESSYKALIKFHPGLNFKDVTVEFLQDFEKSILAKGRSVTTVGFYLRALRTILNLAKEDGTIQPHEYPFGKRKYVMPTSRNIKKALTLDEIKQVFDFQTMQEPRWTGLEIFGSLVTYVME